MKLVLVLVDTIFDAFGLAALFLGIYSDRKNFTKRPSMVQRGTERYRSIAARFGQRSRNVVVGTATIGTASAVGSAGVEVTRAWPQEVAEQIGGRRSA